MPEVEPGQTIAVRHGAFASAVANFRLVHPNECGGVLIGARTSGGLVVHDTLHVPWAPELVQYVRTHAIAQALLDWYLECIPDGSTLGYVGEWHSHPTVHSASDQDLESISDLGRRAGNTVGLIVFGADATSVRPYGYMSDANGRVTSVEVVRSHTGFVDPSESEVLP